MPQLHDSEGGPHTIKLPAPVLCCLSLTAAQQLGQQHGHPEGCEDKLQIPFPALPWELLTRPFKCMECEACSQSMWSQPILQGIH